MSLKNLATAIFDIFKNGSRFKYNLPSFRSTISVLSYPTLKPTLRLMAALCVNKQR